MNEHSSAKQMFVMSGRDFTALKNMLDSEAFSDFDELSDFTDYAVQFRYLDSDYIEEPLDRHDTIHKVQALYDKVKGIIEDISSQTDKQAT